MNVDSTYQIGMGDLLGISVWKDEALTKDVTVLPDGTISFPLLGLVKAAGKTVGQLKAELEKRISEYAPDPVLNLEVKQVNSMIIYVIGRVNSPNRFVLNTNVSVLQGLAMAGGLNPFAKRNSIKVFRTEGGTTVTFPFHYDDVVEGRRLAENIELERGDVIVVP
jgi:polysaccharide export outer membrane protein